MKKEFSIYLDALRFVSSALVLLQHASDPRFNRARLPLSNLGHYAIVVFLVLSGYVIAFVTDTKERTAAAYLSSRASRIYSVALPVVLLTPLLDLAGESLAPALYAGNTTHSMPLLRAATSLTFLNEVWTVSITSFSNVPYWSLCYEVWYYVAFAAFTYLRGRARVAALAAIALLLGPQIVLLSPVWITGVALYRWRSPARWPPALGWALAVVSLWLLAAFVYLDTKERVMDELTKLLAARPHDVLSFSECFPADYALALILAMNFLGVRQIAPALRGLLLPLEGPVRWAAGFSFSLYLLHQPLLLFWAAVLRRPPGPLYQASIVACTLATIYPFSLWTEARRGWMRDRLRALLAAAHDVRPGS
jgi:peptidoglycan/LPS O-acetylase OafA/YrhL